MGPSGRFASSALVAVAAIVLAVAVSVGTGEEEPAPRDTIVITPSAGPVPSESAPSTAGDEVDDVTPEWDDLGRTSRGAGP